MILTIPLILVYSKLLLVQIIFDKMEFGEEEQQQVNGGYDVHSRVREIEGKYNLLRDRALIINQNMIAQYRKTTTEINLMNDELKEAKSEIFKLQETIKHLVNELNMLARKEDLKVLEKYINFWSPLNFVTESDVKKLIEREVKEIGRRNKT